MKFRRSVMDKERDFQFADSRPAWRFRRFSVRGLLIASAVTAAVCALAAWLLHEPNYPIVQISSPVMSPSGDRIAFVVVRGDRRWSDWRSFDGRTFDLHSFRWRHASRVAHERYAESLDVRLAIVSLADGKTTHTGAEISNGSTPLTWAPDESEIVFVSGVVFPNYMGLDSIDLATGTVERIASPQIWMPQFSPDGTYLGYVRGNDLIVEDTETGDTFFIHSGVSHHYWCWDPANAYLFYIRDGLMVCQYDLELNSERVLFSAPQGDDTYPARVVSSPDGSQIGYHFDGWFHTVDLQSGDSARRFECDHYFLDFDWNSTGICYLDAVNGERRKMAAVMVYDPNTGASSAVVTGPFSYPRWLGDSTLLVRNGQSELWSYDVADGSGVKLFGDSTDRLAP